MKSRCQRCGFEKQTEAKGTVRCQSGFDNEKCPKCRAFLRAVPVFINGKYF